MNKTNVVNKAIEHLETLAGIKAKWQHRQGEVDGEIDLYFRDQNFHYFIEVKKTVQNHQLPALLELANKYHPLMIIAEKIYPTVKQHLREKKIPYLDAGGNLYIDEPGKFVLIEGNKLIEEKEAVTNKAFTKTGL